MIDNTAEEIISDKELFRIKVRLKIKKVMTIYYKMIDILTSSIVDEMLASRTFDTVGGKTKIKTSNLEEKVINKEAARDFVNLIDDIIQQQLYGLYREIIITRYVEQNTVYETYIHVREEYLKIPSHSEKYSERTFYRDKWKAELAFYRKVNKYLLKI